MMDGFLRFLWLLSQTFDVMVYLWPITLGLVLHIILATVRSSSRQILKTPNILVPILPTLLTLIVGGFAWHSGNRAGAAIFPEILVGLLFAVQLLASIFVIIRQNGERWLATSVSLLFLWFALISQFIVGMALTNVWF